ncbi:unnamed protein product [Eruca vesicaria subsp. sativa]|uniref:Uncharacterized protein n=1 Tax=Eruca vesicaria subsp. sativa TaxID=29727 RepID=A0ABC8K403_ERUVS|nr:unnamed protein product [Eruca vesicaria subsp. sativa]
MFSPQLSELDISYNDFSGHLSQGLGRCLRLSVLRAGFNNISSEIPGDIYNLSELEQLFLPANKLTGKIDNNITRLKKLTSLELYFNHLEGEIPMDRGLVSSLRSLQLHNNNITGTVPLSLANCTNLIKLNLRINRLGGSLREFEFSQLQSLQVLDLGNNKFTGERQLRPVRGKARPGSGALRGHGTLNYGAILHRRHSNKGAYGGRAKPPSIVPKNVIGSLLEDVFSVEHKEESCLGLV